MDLFDRKCAPCEGGIAKLTPAEVAPLAAALPEWNVVDEQKLTRRFRFPNFVAAMDFVNKLAALAEDEGHHPDFAVSYAVVDVTIWTHDVGGLSENDFILAAKVQRLPR